MEERKKHIINVSDKIRVIDRGVTMKLERPTYPIFYREFYKNYLKIEDGLENEVGKIPLVLSGLFIHLAFEGLVTYTTRAVINNAYGCKEQKIKTL